MDEIEDMKIDNEGDLRNLMKLARRKYFTSSCHTPN